MSDTLNYNPALPESRQFTPPAEGGEPWSDASFQAFLQVNGY